MFHIQCHQEDTKFLWCDILLVNNCCGFLSLSVFEVASSGLQCLVVKLKYVTSCVNIKLSPTYSSQPACSEAKYSFNFETALDNMLLHSCSCPFAVCFNFLHKIWLHPASDRFHCQALQQQGNSIVIMWFIFYFTSTIAVKILARYTTLLFGSGTGVKFSQEVHERGWIYI